MRLLRRPLEKLLHPLQKSPPVTHADPVGGKKLKVTVPQPMLDHKPPQQLPVTPLDQVMREAKVQ